MGFGHPSTDAQSFLSELIQAFYARLIFLSNLGMII